MISGLFTYDSRSRLPNAYREILQFKMSIDNVSNTSRSSSGHSSGETEGPEEGLNDSDVSNESHIGRKKFILHNLDFSLYFVDGGSVIR